MDNKVETILSMFYVYGGVYIKEKTKTEKVRNLKAYQNFKPEAECTERQTLSRIAAVPNPWMLLV